MTDKENKCSCGHDHEEMKDHHQGEGCGCGHDHNHEEMEGYDTLTLTFDDGSEAKCLVLGIFEVEEKTYIALLPEDEIDGEDVYLYAYNEISEEEVELLDIQDDDEFEKVSAKFDELFLEEDESLED
ncbi:DUF1292 domain-containing protein [uncultured Peptoniphilus sp.]|uniref:DUF1292 domain-containing protein n=1 Tax=uncultured Peptoniphilus sp. TaxID=254354 RepID=UPI0028045D59|nr:DUF1292 domain-containing protein [uncultured Peptoniphilus sp.]